MNRKTKIIVSITGITLVGLMLLGLTYGYFITKVVGNTNAKSISVSSAKKMVEYTDLSEEISGKIIEPGYETIKVFTVKNIGDTSATYHIYLDNVVNEFIRTQDITYTLYRKSGNNTIDTSNLSDSDIVANGYLPKTNNYILLNEVIDTPNNYYTYALKINYINSSENQDEDQGHTFSFKVQLHGEMVNPFSEDTLAYNILNNSMNKTNGTEFTLTPKTKPAAERSSFIYEKGTDPTSFTLSRSSATDYYISYADDYTVNESTGKLTLVNPTVATTKYTTDTASTLAGKYAVWSTSIPTVSNTQNQRIIYKISTNVSDITSTIKYATINVNSLERTSAEKELSITTDDYGDSYYYRGGVTDNYVNFAGMCWRVVRIQGDGSIKLILEDYNTTCNSSTYTGNWSDGSNYIFSGDSSSKPDFLNYSESDGVAYALKSFQTKKISNYLDKLKVDNWCYCDNIIGTNAYGVYTDVYKRVFIDKRPSLVCTGTKLTKFSDDVDMYVGILTADETLFAGGTSDSANNTYYLTNNNTIYNKLRWPVLSLYGSSDSLNIMNIFYLDYNGVLNHGYTGTDFVVRPSITLLSTTEIFNGDGTISNPYTIK